MFHVEHHLRSMKGNASDRPHLFQVKQYPLLNHVPPTERHVPRGTIARGLIEIRWFADPRLGIRPCSQLKHQDFSVNWRVYPSRDETILFVSQAKDTAEATLAMESAPPTPSRAPPVLHRRPGHPAPKAPSESQL